MSPDETARPLPERGFDRAQAEHLATMFLHPYQPPPTCAHKPGRVSRRWDGVRGLFQECEECHMVVGVVR